MSVLRTNGPLVISIQYLLLDDEFSHFLFFTDYTTAAETVDIVVELEFFAIQYILDQMECSQTHYFFLSFLVRIPVAF